MAITVTHSKVSTIPDDADTSLVRPSDWNADHTLVGLGTMAEQNANNVTITGGTISGVTVPASNITGIIGVPNGGTGASTLTGYVKGNGTATMTAASTIPNTDVTGLGTMSTQNANAVAITGGTISGTTITGYIPTTEKGVALGVATLDAGGKVPQSQIPLMGDLNYQGTWNASTNTPTLTSSVGTKGYYYVVDVAGSTNLNGITDWQIGDWAIFNGTVWQKVDNTDAVTSVNGAIGTVVLTTTNITEGTNLYYTDARSRAAISAGTGINYNSSTGVITNSSPSLGGDVVGPASSTDNAVARFDSTTGKLIQNSVVTVGDTGAVAGVTTLAATTSVTTPIVQATNSAGLALRNSAGTTQISMGAGGGDNVTVAVSTNLNGTNAQIDISPTGTGHVHIKPTGVNSVEIIPTSVGKMDNVTIGATTAAAGSFTNLSVTGTTSFDGAQGTAGQVLTSAGTGNTPTWTTPTTGTVTSVTGTSPVVSSGGTTPAISMPAATTSVNGYLTSTDWTTFNNKGSGTVTAVSVASANGFAGTSSGGATPALTLSTSITGLLKGNGTAISAATAGTDYSAGTSALGTGILKTTTTTGALTIAVAADFPTLNQNTTGTASNVTGTVVVANGGTGATTLTGLVVGNGTSAMTTVTAPSGAVVGTTDTQTLTSKRVNPRAVAAGATSGTLTPNGDTTDVFNAFGLTGSITMATPSGTPVDGQRLMLRFEDNGTGRGITWTGTSGAYRAVGVTLPTTTVASKVTYVGCVYNSTDVFWDVIAVATQA